MNKWNQAQNRSQEELTMRIPIIGMRHTAETFLSGSVPDLQFDACAIDDDHFVLHVAQLSYASIRIHQAHFAFVTFVYVCVSYVKRMNCCHENAIVIKEMQLINEMCMPNVQHGEIESERDERERERDERTNIERINKAALAYT